MSTGDQFIAALISSFFDIFVAIMLGVFNSILLPFIQSLFGVTA